MRLIYRNTLCTQVQFVSAVTATSGASDADTFRLLRDLLGLFQYPNTVTSGSKQLLADDVDRITYGQCKIDLEG